MKRPYEGKRVEREQTTIRLPADLKEQIQREAECKKRSFNNLVEIILNRWVNEAEVEYQQL